MSSAQAILIIGGLANFLFSSLAGFFILWLRTRDVTVSLSRYAVLTHTSAVMNASLLLGLSVAIPHTGFIPTINNGIAVVEVIASVLSSVRNVLSWKNGYSDAIAQGGDTSNRLRGLVNMLHLLGAAALLYGVTRSTLGA